MDIIFTNARFPEEFAEIEDFTREEFIEVMTSAIREYHVRWIN